MSSKAEKNITLTSQELKDLESYCKLNGFEVEKVVKESYLQGFRIEKYGLLGNPGAVHEKQVLKEVIVEKRVEVPVEVIIEKIVIEYVEIEKEIIREVPREIVVEKIVEVVKVAELLEELERLRNLPPTIVDREVIKEVPVEVVREVEVVKEIKVEVPVEVVKEVLIEKKTSEDTQRLQETLGKLRQQSIEKDVKIKQLEDEINLLKSLQQQQKAVYLRGSNLDDKLYR
jgi:hypothetical protein